MSRTYSLSITYLLRLYARWPIELGITFTVLAGTVSVIPFKP